MIDTKRTIEIKWVEEKATRIKLGVEIRHNIMNNRKEKNVMTNINKNYRMHGESETNRLNENNLYNKMENEKELKKKTKYRNNDREIYLV